MNHWPLAVVALLLAAALAWSSMHQQIQSRGGLPHVPWGVRTLLQEYLSLHDLGRALLIWPIVLLAALSSLAALAVVALFAR